MYVCGITVYDYCHVGHARMMVVFDMVRRWLLASGYRVTVFDKTGKKLTNIPVSEGWVGNVTFGDKDRDLLFITASKKVFGVKMRVKGAH